MTHLSVNINKIATLRNARGGNNPDVIKVALDCEKFGADGITVHPRPDERHITYKDVQELKKVLTTEFNIEGNPTEEKFVQLVLDTKPHQVTLVPDAQGQLTSDHGWDTVKHQDYLIKTIALLKMQVFGFQFLWILLQAWWRPPQQLVLTELNYTLSHMLLLLQKDFKKQR